MSRVGVCRNLALFIGMGAVAFHGAASSARPIADWYVDDNAPGDPRPGDPTAGDPFEDGTSEHPFDAIQEGLDAAADGEVILVADGVYQGAGNYDLRFNGKAVTLRSASGPAQCIIDCGEAGRGVSFLSEESLDTVLEGFTLRRCTGRIEDAQGGGIRCVGASPTIRNCVITECLVQDFISNGGGLYCQSGSPHITGCRFEGNRALGLFSSGGGLFLDSCHALIEDSVIADNFAGFAGGGIVCELSSRPILRRTEVRGNFAEFAGGGMAIQSASQPTVQGCVFRGNQAFSTGGIRVDGSDLMIQSSLIVGNISMDEDQGGLDTFSNSNTEVVNCTIVGNSGVGLGCFDPNSEVLISNCIVSGNANDVLNCGTYYSLIGSAKAKDGDGNIIGDPMFSGDDDYRLQASSPCVNRGDPKFKLDPGVGDLDGHSRVLCERVDMGAFEFGIGDIDCDHEMDLSDFAPWSRCAAGPREPFLSAGCEAFDFDADGDVDLADYGGFANTFPWAAD